MIIAQTSLMAASLAILIYIAVIVTGNLTASNDSEQIIQAQSQMDKLRYEQMSNSLDYIHKSDISSASTTTLLNGITLASGEFILLYDSTPFASRGHIALNIPCDQANPVKSPIQVLAGRAPDLLALTPGYISQVSQPPNMCIYHAQFGFGDPVTDVLIKNVDENEISFKGPHSSVITVHESFIPANQSLKDVQHEEDH